VYFRDFYSHPLTRFSGTYGWETQVGQERVSVFCHKFFSALFYGFIFDLFGQDVIVLSGSFGFKPYMLFWGFDHAYLGYVVLPNIQQPSGIIVSCLGWASFGGLRQVYSILPGGDFPVRKYLEKNQTWHILDSLSTIFSWHKLLKFYPVLPRFAEMSFSGRIEINFVEFMTN